MKKLYLFFTTILSLGFNSQTILNQQETGTRTVSDPQAVILAQGFHAKSDISNPFIAKIGTSTDIPNNPTDSQAGSSNPGGTNSPQGISFHDTQGNIEVNGGGQLQYTLPIALPPGVKSVAPQVNLVYTSGGGNGIAGYGWNISGITAISRIGRTIEKDGEVRGIKLDYSDYYSFNGQRLILKAGEYGKDGAEYVTEKFSNIKVKSVGAISGQQWQGPEYWEVTFEDGSQAWYGAVTTNGSSAARTPIEYNIVKWGDAQGNYITYNYSQVSNVAVISSIQWGGNETIPKSHFNEVKFNYITRNLKEVSYSNGVLFEQSRLLYSIQVKTNDSQFKKYVVTYDRPNVNGDNNKTIDYQFVKSIKEYNSRNEESNPVNFTTDALITKTEEKPFSDFDNLVASGDYNGDGLIDFIVRQPAQNGRPEGYYIYFDAVNNATNSFVYLGTTSTYFPSSGIYTFNIKPADNIIKPKQGLLIVKYSTATFPPITSNIELKYYSVRSDSSVLNTTNNPLTLEYSKTISAHSFEYDDNLYPPLPDPNYEYFDTTKQSSLEGTKEIDIDSDGLSETIMAIHDKKCYSHDIGGRIHWGCYSLGYRYLIVDSNDMVNNTIHTTAPIDKNILYQASIMDFDNDGVQDIMSIKENGTTNVSFYTKNKYTNAVVYQTVSTPLNNLYQYTVKKEGNNYLVQQKNIFVIKGLTDAIKFGDLNGDKNIEVLAPLNKNISWDNGNVAGWSIYLNNGSGLSEFCQGFTEYYKIDNNSNIVAEYSYPGLVDLDNDGKSEFVNFYAGYNLQGYKYSALSLINFSEFKYDPTNAQFKWTYKTNIIFPNQTGGSSMYPIYGDFKVNGSYSKILFVSKSLTNSNDRKIISYSHYNLGYNKNIKTITQGGLTTSVDYRELDPAVNPGLYAPVKTEQYPYMELDKLSQSYVVSSLDQIINDQSQSYIRTQEFKYRGMLTHLQGRGIIGFRQTAKTNWHIAGVANTETWSGVEMDPLNEGVPIKEWSVKAFNDNNLIFPADISENNNQLLSYKKTEYQTDILANGVKAIVPWKTKSKDFLKDITTDSEITYGNYYLPAQTNTNVNNGFATSQTGMAYTHNPSGTGKNYYIGRPSSKTETTTAYGDTKASEESYAYDNNLLSQLIKKPTGSAESIYENYQYDGWGNITEKKVSYKRQKVATSPSMIQTEKAQYDDKGRFAIEKTDNLGLKTNITYNDWGQVLTQTDPLGVILTNTYDGWGKLITSKTNLAGTTAYAYTRDSNGNIIITQYDPDGNISKKYTNRLGQEYKTQAKSFGQNQYVAKYKVYDPFGRTIKESEPYFDTATEELPAGIKWNTISYDDTYFPAKVTAVAFNGKQMETLVSGRTTTVKELNGYNRTTTKTTDVLGNVITSTDKGGTINFSYNAAGQQTSAQYDTNIVTTTYDDWGRKTQFTDPSNGTYTYDYDGLGRIIRTTSPKGYKEYVYNNLGQLTTQEEHSDDGTSTNKSITYSYNPKGLIVSKTGTSAGKAYSSFVTYDEFGRVLSSSENSNGRYFMKKGITYDDKMRVVSYEKSLYSSGQYTKVTIENVYDVWSGELYQVKDKTQNKILWELQSTNANGQVLTARLGGTSITNQYDSNNFLNSTQHKNAANNATILQMTYSFNAIKNELNSRTRGGDFNIIENFEYDNNNRLVNWTDPVTGAFTQNAVRNTYDQKGRITDNDQVGEIKFTNSNKVYQATGMVLNDAGHDNFDDKLLQKITYNENNDPIFIDGVNGDVAFTYGLTGMRQTATYGGNFEANGQGKYTKYYSEDGSYEVIKNNQTGQERHILYIGDTPYESDITFIKESWDNGSYYYLHKDYLGSILAITSEDGNPIEQRHYDAWGNFTHLKVGAQPMIAGMQQITDYLANNNLLLDRGYTSHEHFAEVGLIHMNGRLYDPLLRRFLNADENIQDPYNTQNYNKYGYVLNNPLMFNDPSGEFLFLAPIIAYIVANAAAIGTAVLAGAFISIASALVVAGFTGNAISAGGILKSAFIGAVSGAVTFGIGSIFTNTAGSLTSLATSLSKSIGGLGLEIVRAGTHAISQGILSLVQGGGFLSGAAGGFFGSLGAAGFSAVAGNVANKAIGQIAFGALSGGIGAELSGGNFWVGAVAGGMTAGLNHAMHSGDMEPDNGYDKNGKKINDNGGNTTDYMYDDNGKVISSTSVKVSFSQGGEVSSSFEGYGFRHYTQGTGGALYDPSFDIMKDYVLGKAYFKVTGIMLTEMKVGQYFFKGTGDFIAKYVPKLGANRYLRIGISNSKGRQVFRVTYGNNKTHWFDYDLGKIPKIKK